MTRQSLVIGESISGRSQVAQPQFVPCGSRKNGRSNDLTNELIPKRLVIGESISGRSQVAQPQVVPCGSRKNGRSNDLTPTNVLLSVSPLAVGRK